jgi:hypothetical protein
MKKYFPLRGYFLRAKVFGFIITAIVVYGLVSIVVHFLQD